MSNAPAAGDAPAPCPRCGAVHPPGAAACPAGGGRRPLAPMTWADEVPDRPPPDRPVPASFSLATLMQIIAVLGIGLALAIQVPPLGLPLLVMAGIALGRTIRRARQWERAGQPMPPPEQVRTFARTLGALAVLGLAGLIAFTVVCFPIGLIAMDSGGTNGHGMTLALLSGGLAGLLAIWGTYRLLNAGD